MPCIVRGHRPLCLHHLEPHRQRCTFCIDADTEHTHHTHTGPTRPPTNAVPGSVPGLASEPPSTDMKKSLSKVLPDAPKERTFNTVGKAQAGLRPEQAQRAAASPTHLIRRPRVWAQASPSPASSPAAGTVWTMAPALTTSTETQDTIGRPQTANHRQEQRGYAAPLNSSGEKYIDFMLSDRVIYFFFSAKLRLFLRRLYAAL